MEPLTQLGAVVLAAGRSTRFRSRGSKLVHPLAGRPLIQWSLSALREIGAQPLVVVVGYEADAVMAASGAGVAFAHQQEQRGTGHAVLATEPLLGGFAGDLLIVNPDVPLLRAETLRHLVGVHRAANATLTLATATLADAGGWGRIVRREGVVHAVVEDRDADHEVRAIREVNVGLYCVKPDFLFAALRRLAPNNAQGEIYLTDVVAAAAAARARIADVEVDAAEVGQINSRRELVQMEHTMQVAARTRWMEAGVTLEDPDTVYIEPDVTIGRDTIIGPNVHLRGRTVIGEGCRLDGTDYLTDAVCGDNVHIRFGVVIAGATVAPGVEVGPLVELRPGTAASKRARKQR